MSRQVKKYILIMKYVDLKKMNEEEKVRRE